MSKRIVSLDDRPLPEGIRMRMVTCPCGGTRSGTAVMNERTCGSSVACADAFWSPAVTSISAVAPGARSGAPAAVTSPVTHTVAPSASAVAFASSRASGLNLESDAIAASIAAVAFGTGAADSAGAASTYSSVGA